jgi:NAD(P)-dependent dehydrogenase (short-subunit alcohol dehydrogenase family)
MRILIVGANGTVGRAATMALGDRHEIIKVGRTSGDINADLTDPASIKSLFAKSGKVDAIICTAGHSHFGPLASMTEKDFRKGLDDKLMGQVNLVLIGMDHVSDGGSITLTTGVLDRDPVRGGANAAAVNGAISAFVRSAALEMPRAIRINVVSPALLEDSVTRYAGAFPGHIPVGSVRVGQAYVKSVEGGHTGQVIIADG